MVLICDSLCVCVCVCVTDKFDIAPVCTNIILYELQYLYFPLRFFTHKLPKPQRGRHSTADKRTRVHSVFNAAIFEN